MLPKNSLPSTDEASVGSPPALESWLQRQARRERRVVYLEDALLGGRFVKYALYRLRFFFLRHLCEALLHGVKFLFLWHIFYDREFMVALWVTVVAGLATSFWWGALEVMRGRVRHSYRTFRRERIPREVVTWLRLAGWLATITAASIVVGVLWVGVAHLTVFHLYVMSVGVRLALDLVTRTYHSGIYAIRRIYRPLPALVAVELVGFVAIFGMWPWLAEWSFPVGLLLSGVVGTGITLHYTTRVYRYYGFALGTLVFGPLPRLARADLTEAGAAGVAYALMKFDSLLILAALAAGSGRDGELFLILFAVAPTIQAGFNWAQLFYFDLKRLETRWLRSLRRLYARKLEALAWALGFVFWGLAGALSTLILQRGLGDIYLAMGPFFLSRSALALAQIQAFAERRYRELLWIGVMLLGAISWLRWGHFGDTERLLQLGILTTLAWAGLRLWQRPRDDTVRSLERPLLDWLEELLAIEGPVRIRCARFPMARGRNSLEKRTHWSRRKFAERLSYRIGPTGAVTEIQPNLVVWYERGRSLPEAHVLETSAGLIEKLEETPLERNGVAAVRTAGKQGLLGRHIRPEWCVAGRVFRIRETRKAFTDMFPSGRVYSPAESNGKLQELTPKDRRRVLSDAAYFAGLLQTRPGPSPYEVTSLSTRGELQLIFVVERTTDRRTRSRWQRRIREGNLEAALAEQIVSSSSEPR